jgi:PAS domain S-box-containing protein
MSLRSRCLTIVVAVTLVMAAAISGFGAWILERRFQALERSDVAAHLSRVEALLARERSFLETKCADWGEWNDAVDFLAGRAPDFHNANLVDSALTTNDLAAIAYLGRDGQPFAEKVAAGQSLATLIPVSWRAPGSSLMAAAAVGRRASTIIMVGTVPVMIASGPVMDSTGAGPVSGTVMMARVFDRPSVQACADQLGLDLALVGWGGIAALADPAALAELERSGRTVVVAPDGQQVSGYARLADPQGRPLLLIRTVHPRTVYQAGLVTIRDLVVFAVAGIGLLGGMVALVFDRLAGSRLVRLATEVAELEAEPERRLDLAGNDEISRLAKVIDRAVHAERATASALRQSQTRYLQLFEHAADALLVLDDERIVDVNRAALGVFAAQTQAALIGRPFATLQVASREAEDGSSSSWSASDDRRQVQLRDCTGREFRAALRLTAIVLGTRNATLVHVEDVTSRHRREEEQAALALLAENTTEMVAVVRTSGTLSYLNRAGRAMLGLAGANTQDEVSLSAHLDPRIWRDLQAGCQGDHGWRSEAAMLVGTGKTAPVLIAANGIRDPRGRLLLYGLVVRDLSVEREREAQLESARTAAVDAARAKQEFLAMISHELRTPLNGVIGMTSLLAATALDRDQREFADTISLCADNLLHLINDLLDLNRIDSGALELEHIPFSLREIADEAVQIVSERALAKGLDLGSVVEADVPLRIIGDPTRLRQVLVNLLANAVKFTEGGQVSLTVAMAAGGASASRQDVVIAVADTGIGIAEDVIPLLFRPFTQADSSTTRRFGGSGLGLAICQRLVGLMGGEITITSRPGLGSVFQLTVPFPLSLGPTHAPQASGLALVVEPGSAARQALTCRLEAHGFTVIAEATLGQALLLLGPRPPALACLPWSPTGPTGHHLREAVGDPALPVIITAAVTRHLDLARAGQSGATALLTRPYRWSQVDEVLAAIPGRQAAPATAVRGRILLVEDDPVIAMLVRRIIDSEGHELEHCTHGQQALEQARPGRWDLALVDIGLPDLEGYEVLSGLRQKAGQELVLVAVTGEAAESDRARCLACGSDGYLAKPFTAEALLDQIRARLQ